MFEQHRRKRAGPVGSGIPLNVLMILRQEIGVVSRASQGLPLCPISTFIQSIEWINMILRLSGLSYLEY